MTQRKKRYIDADELLAKLEDLDDQAWTRKNTTMGLTTKWIMAIVRDMVIDEPDAPENSY